MTTPILSATNVSKSFGGLRAVRDVSFEVRPGEMFGIAGPNGSGKSTLFNIITGIPFGPTSGEVRFKGERIDGRPAYAIARAGLCRTFQKDAEFPDLSAADSLEISAVYNGRVDRRTAARRADEAFALVAFDGGRRDMLSSELSVFEKKQLMIASALVSRPAVLMLDEPASGLTRPEIEQLDALLRNVNASGVTILLIEHVLALLLSVSQRLLILNQGEVLAEGEPSAVVRRPDVVEAYLGKRSQ
ncbi:ABC transporter ATP-binding protein [Labrys monachus]|uniref:Branched-chain amino acid transport system ATP-binding protein n=1 Tax=Labrys monachus TaxID=217067 RepID=A0ABU0FIM7_9HYPH|nr:ABC transporter ATP-binding protein [Labrys monachus]MDQ0394459.1 branched-chain amino acid transport system ATP-binding protein [Labrys monachus]